MDVRAHNIREKYKNKKKKKAVAQWMTSRIWTCASVFPCVFHNDSECVVASVVFGDFCVH